MSIESTCSGCGKLLRVANEHAGKQARCPACGNIYAVPHASASPILSPAAPSPSAAYPSVVTPLAVPMQPLEWYMKTPEGQIYGPVTRSGLNTWVSEGRVSSDCQLREGANGAWQSSDAVFPTLRAPRTRATAASTGGGYAARPQQTFGGQPLVTGHSATTHRYAPQYYGATAYRQPHRGGLILTLALLGWFVCPIFAVIAWTMGSEDLRKIRSGQMDPAGQGLTQAGQVLGMIQSILLLLGLGFIFYVPVRAP